MSDEESLAKTGAIDGAEKIQEPAQATDAPEPGSLDSNGVKPEGEDASTQLNEKEFEPSLMEKVKSLTKLTTSVSGNLVPLLRDKLRQLQREKVQWEKERRELKEHIADLELAVTNAHAELSEINELLA
ncbi:hypothetical protein N7540_002191 [Penicillium herquei]|nr:hypothetical protein N7540_002191 [Penicillium herquei]